VPVFGKGASDTDNSLIATDDAMVVENNYGYSGPGATEQGKTTTPGLERVDVDRATGRCTKRWHADEIAPSVVAKLSLGNGLVYTYTKPKQPDNADGWYLTAVDWQTGKTVYKRLAGEGLGFNNNYAPVSIGPDGTAYVGVLGGLVGLRDATAPDQVDVSGGGPSRAALRAGVRMQRGKRFCIARVRGADRALARRLSMFNARGHFVRRDSRPPLRLRYRKRKRTFRFVVTARDGRRAAVRTRC
jgi:hypothetical protein